MFRTTSFLDYFVYYTFNLISHFLAIGQHNDETSLHQNRVHTMQVFFFFLIVWSQSQWHIVNYNFWSGVDIGGPETHTATSALAVDLVPLQPKRGDSKFLAV